MSLTLSRTIGETIIIGDDIYVTVEGIRGKNIRLNILAPREIPVHRLEVHQAIAAKGARVNTKEPDADFARPENPPRVFVSSLLSV